MSIELRIIDPKNTPHEDLKNAMRFLAACAGLIVNFGDVQTISPEDTPDAGLDTEKIFAGKPGVVPDALSIAGAGTSPTVPAVPTDTSTSAIVPVPPAPTPAAPGGIAAPATGNPVTLDSANMPWDARIHAETKTTIADGTWRKKRGVDAAVVAAVEVELRQAMNIPTPAAPVIPVVPNGIGAIPAPPVPPVPTLPDASPGASVGANGNTADPATQANKFPLLMAKVTSAMAANTLTQDVITSTLTSLGLPTTLPSLVTRPDMIPTVAMLLFGSPDL